MSLTLGGRLALRITLPAADLSVGIEGFYEVIEPPHQLVHTWRNLDEALVTTVRFELEPHGTRTRLRVHHRGFVDPVDLEQNHGGWIHHLAELSSAAADLETRSWPPP